MSLKREKEIDKIVARLQSFRSDLTFADRLYAVDANIEFLNAIKTLPRFIKWLFTRATKLDGSRLLELTDFPVPEWDIQMHECLIEIQRRKRPGLIEPLVSAIVEFIKKEDRDLVLADLGAGGMEVERQVITRLVAMNWRRQVIFLGVDKSEITRQIAKKNLEGLLGWADVREAGGVDQQNLETIKKATRKNFTILLCSNDIFELSSEFSLKYFDLIYHSLFRHHLRGSEQKNLDFVVARIASGILEYDGYKNWITVVPQTLVGWSKPVFFNAEIFSDLRFENKQEVVLRSRGSDWKNRRLDFYRIGYYLLQLS